MSDTKFCVPKTIEVIAPRAPALIIVGLLALAVSILALVKVLELEAQRDRVGNEG